LNGLRLEKPPTRMSSVLVIDVWVKYSVLPPAYKKPLNLQLKTTVNIFAV